MRTVSSLVLGRLLQEMLQDCEGSVLTDSVFLVELGVLLCFIAALVEDEFAGSWDSAAPHWVMDGFVQARVPTVLPAQQLPPWPPTLPDWEEEVWCPLSATAMWRLSQSWPGDNPCGVFSKM